MKSKYAVRFTLEAWTEMVMIARVYHYLPVYKYRVK